MQWLGQKGIPFVICFTKLDKLSKKERAENISLYQQEMLSQWEELPQIFLSSSTKKIGQEELLQFIEQTNRLF
jgi:GTP-binding protein